MSRVYSQVKMHENNNSCNSNNNNNRNVRRAEEERTHNVQKRKQKRKAKLNVAETPMAWIVFPSFAQQTHHHDHHHHHIYNTNCTYRDNGHNNKDNSNHYCPRNILPRCVWQVLCISGDVLCEFVHDLEMINNFKVGSKLVQEEEEYLLQEELINEERLMLHSNWNNRKLKQYHFRTTRVLFAQLVRPQYTLQLVNAVYIAETKPQALSLSLYLKKEEEEQEESIEKEQESQKLEKAHKKRNSLENKSENIINSRFRCGVRTIGVIERSDLLHELGKPAFPLDYGGVDYLRTQSAISHNQNNVNSCMEHNLQLSQRTQKQKVKSTNNKKIYLELFWRTLQCYGTVANAARRVVVRASRSRFTFPYISSIHNKETYSANNIKVNRFVNKSANNNCSSTSFLYHHYETNSLHASLNYSQAQRGALLLAVKCRSVEYYNANNTSHDKEEHKALLASELLESEERVELIEVRRVGVLTSEPFFMRKVGSEVGLVWCCLADPLQTNRSCLSPTWEELLEETEEEKFEQFTNDKSITWCLCSPSHALKLEHLSRTCTRSGSTSHQLENTHANTVELPSAKRVKIGSNDVIDGNKNKDNNNRSTQSNIIADMSEIARSQ